MKIASGVLVSLMVASGVISSGRATAQERPPRGPLEDLRAQIEVLENRVEFLEQALSSFQTSLAGLVCPEDQFVRGFNSSGDLLCAAPMPPSEVVPGEPILLPDLAEALQARLNELLAPNEFPFEDLSGNIGGGLGSFSLTDLALRLACLDECVPTLQAVTDDGTRVRVEYELAGPVEVSGEAQIVITDISANTRFVMTYEDAVVRFSVRIDEADGDIRDFSGAVLPDVTEVEFFEGKLDATFQLVANLFVSHSKAHLDDLMDQLILEALSDLVPIELPNAGM